MKRLASFGLCVLSVCPLYAENAVELTGTKAIPLVVQQPKTRALHSTPYAKTRYIQLLNLELSDEAWQSLERKIEETATPINPTITTSVQLGMRNVPVLDQGPYGSCAMFANTAALDAALNQGDYISPLCELQLGNYLQSTSYNPSGWNGSMGPIVLHQMTTYGIVTVEQQKKLGCGGLTDYPNSGKVPTTMMSPEDFHAISTSLIDKNIGWSAILDPYQRFIDHADMNKVLSEVKKTLTAGDRITFGVLLFDPHLGTVGAVGKNHVANDTWILTPEIINDIKEDGDYGGHEMIITGFDDNAKAVDDKGRVHKGLLKLRNSWGSLAGDEGNFYMSYDYFVTLTIEAQRIRAV
ncbi:MAG: C1 family peptidase [Legionellaceae bacterium]